MNELAHRKIPDTYTRLDELAATFIAQGHSEDVAFELAANECESNDQATDVEALQWD